MHQRVERGESSGKKVEERVKKTEGKKNCLYFLISFFSGRIYGRGCEQGIKQSTLR